MCGKRGRPGTAWQTGSSVADGERRSAVARGVSSWRTTQLAARGALTPALWATEYSGTELPNLAHAGAPLRAQALRAPADATRGARAVCPVAPAPYRGAILCGYQYIYAPCTGYAYQPPACLTHLRRTGQLVPREGHYCMPQPASALPYACTPCGTPQVAFVVLRHPVDLLLSEVRLL